MTIMWRKSDSDLDEMFLMSYKHSSLTKEMHQSLLMLDRFGYTDKD